MKIVIDIDDNIYTRLFDNGVDDYDDTMDINTAIRNGTPLPKQQPCEDCISRSKAIEMLGDEPENWTDTEKEIQEVNDYRWFKSILESLPSVTPKARWIPCSERLPEEDGYYLVTNKWKGSYSGDVYIETNIADYTKKLKEWDCVGVIAWMPLPQPYAESEE